jgi:hypothetical protein
MLGIVFSNFGRRSSSGNWSASRLLAHRLHFAKPSAVDAGKKAFLTNRIGDLG